MKRVAFAVLMLMLSCVAYSKPEPRLEKAFREDRAGWVYVHMEGTPSEIGFQHGYLLAPEIDDALQMIKYYMKHLTRKGWKFHRSAAQRMFWNKLDKEYQDEIEGIAEGLRARGKKYDKMDVTVLNGWMELAWYYVPYLAEKAKPGAGNNKAPGNCSAFIATGSYTSDGKIVMGHNAWVDYIVGERWNVIADIIPTKGNRMFMDTYPGFIHSGDDFVVTSSGILITETTISQFKGFDENGIPEFMRARKAAQYANSIDDFVRIMTTGNNGGYANDWLVGDIKTNEIARLELGLKNYKVWRTQDGVYVGSNFPSDEKVITQETTFNINDNSTSPNARKLRWEKLVEENKGKIDVEVGKLFEADHYDQTQQVNATNRRVICGHVDEDPQGAPEWDWAPYNPGGAVQGKVVTTELAKELKFWARMGYPCGKDFIASKFFKAHPKHKWQARYLRDMKSYPWTLFEAKK